MIPGQSKEIEWEGDHYTVTRCMDQAFTVWKDGTPVPYRVGIGNRGVMMCQCPDHIYRKRTCKHIAMVRRL